MKIAVYQDKLAGLWHYAPEQALSAIPSLMYDSDNGLASPQRAVEAVRRDPSIDQDCEIVFIPINR